MKFHFRQSDPSSTAIVAAAQSRGAIAGAWTVGLILIAGCTQQMADQPRYEPLEASDFFGDGRSERPVVEHTVARREPAPDDPLVTGRVNDDLIATNPLPIDERLLRRGQQRFDIFCAPCHDRTGTGQGMIVQRGFRAPPSYHIDRLRDAPDGYFFEVISSGFRLMPSYRAQIPVHDRWAIVAYIRALQRSQNANVSDIPPEERAKWPTD